MLVKQRGYAWLGERWVTASFVLTPPHKTSRQDVEEEMSLGKKIYGQFHIKTFTMGPNIQSQRLLITSVTKQPAAEKDELRTELRKRRASLRGSWIQQSHHSSFSFPFCTGSKVLAQFKAFLLIWDQAPP